MTPAASNFIRALNEYATIFNSGRDASTSKEYEMARILHRIDRSGRRRRYLAQHQFPSIDGYIDWCSGGEPSTSD